MSDDKNKIIINAKWTKKNPDWCMPLEVKIINNTDNVYISPEISFDVSNINYSRDAGIRIDTGFKPKTFTKDRITGKLSDTKALLNAHSEVVLLFELNLLTHDQYPNIPEYFWFNKELIANSVEPSGSCFDWSSECLNTGITCIQY